jgi:thiamine pyrophosphate-dependent acetolactate synthase large subunit-like protein
LSSGSPHPAGGKNSCSSASTKPGLQADHKGVIGMNRVEDVPRRFRKRNDLALSGEPGPVLLQYSRDVLSAQPSFPPNIPRKQSPAIDGSGNPMAAVEEAAAPCIGERPFLRQGRSGRRIGPPGTARRVGFLAVFTTGSGRGVLPEDHALALEFDFTRSDGRVLNE